MRTSALATLVTLVTLATGFVVAPPASSGPAGRQRPDAGTLRLTGEPGSPVRSLEVPASVARQPQDTTSYAMVGLTWRGADPALRVRTRGPEGWRPWLALEVLEDRAGEGAHPDLRATDLVWVGDSDGVQVDVHGSGHRDLALVLVDPGVLAADRTAAAAVPSSSARRVSPADERAPLPPLVRRKQWGADPSWRNGSPRYNSRIRQVYVHHTASGNDYTRADVPAILRGMYWYHTQSLGWFDLAYNFVVDRFGRSWVGRSGGAAKPVRGAHTLGFNHVSVGIAVIGNFEVARPTPKALTAVVQLASWKLDLHGRDAVGATYVRSEGSDRFAAGRRVLLPTVAGHLATNQTACPGAHLHARLPGIRVRAQKRVDRYGA